MLHHEATYTRRGEIGISAGTRGFSKMCGPFFEGLYAADGSIQVGNGIP